MMGQKKVYTAEDFAERKAAADVLLSVLHPLTACCSEGCAFFKLGVTAAHYEERSAWMESFARPLWGLVPFFLGGSSNPEFEEIYRKGIVSGTDPASPEYWGECHDYDQKFCEMPAIALGLLLVPQIFWDPLTAEQKHNLAEWLNEINRHDCCSCNWQFFNILTNVALKKLGQKYSDECLRRGLAMINAYYDQGGWYKDGNEGDKDYYNPFVMQTFGLLYAHFMKEEDPAAAAQFMQRAREFAEDFIYWFSPDGASFPYGRSMTYRFAEVSFFSLCAMLSAEVLPLPVLKGLISRHLADWMNRPVFDNAGILTIGYGYPNLQMSESYNAPGSPYWALMAFFFLGLPEDHPYWKCAAAPLPELERIHYLPHVPMIVQHGAGQVTALVPGRAHADEHGHTLEKYSKFAYSSRFGFSISRSDLNLSECAPDSTLCIEVFGHCFTKNLTDSYETDEHHIRMQWSPFRGIRIRTDIEATEKGQIRTHVIESDTEARAYDAGFAVCDDSTAECTADGGMAMVRNRDGYCSVKCIAGDGTGEILKAAPNTNLIYPKTKIPMICYSVGKGTQIIRTEVRYL